MDVYQLAIRFNNLRLSSKVYKRSIRSVPDEVTRLVETAAVLSWAIDEATLPFERIWKLGSSILWIF
jgi:hypothetical protein